MNAAMERTDRPEADRPLVMKFGGTSVGSAQRMKDVAVLARVNAQNGVLVVVSAMSGVTDSLFRAARLAFEGNLEAAYALCEDLRAKHYETHRELSPGDGSAEEFAYIDTIIDALKERLHGVALLRELSPRSMDAIASSGELLSGQLVARAIGCRYIDARTLMKTDSRFGEARPDMEAIKAAVKEQVAPLMKPWEIVVTQGYIGSDQENATTTLGRGGSDFSASIFGAALGAREIQIWTDVEGILTCDPRIVPNAKTVEVLGYFEAAELAAFGAKVLHPATVKPALDAGIPVTVRNTMKPEGKYSTIKPGKSSGRPVVALAMRKNVSIISVKQEDMTDQYGFLAKLFKVFGDAEVSVDLISTSEISVSISLDSSSPLAKLKKELQKLGTVDILPGRVVIAVVGDLLKRTPAVLNKVFTVLEQIEVDLVSLGANSVNLSFIVKQEDAEFAMKKLHEVFFEK